MAKVYVLFYDVDYGDRENWNTFYTPCEVFADAETRRGRIDFVKSKVDDEDFDFHTLDIDVSSTSDLPILGHFEDDLEEDDEEE
jgi:hypothetical protein